MSKENPAQKAWWHCWCCCFSQVNRHQPVLSASSSPSHSAVTSPRTSHLPDNAKVTDSPTSSSLAQGALFALEEKAIQGRSSRDSRYFQIIDGQRVEVQLVDGHYEFEGQIVEDGKLVPKSNLTSPQSS